MVERPKITSNLNLSSVLCKDRSDLIYTGMSIHREFSVVYFSTHFEIVYTLELESITKLKYYTFLIINLGKQLYFGFASIYLNTNYTFDTFRCHTRKT